MLPMSDEVVAIVIGDQGLQKRAKREVGGKAFDNVNRLGPPPCLHARAQDLFPHHRDRAVVSPSRAFGGCFESVRRANSGDAQVPIPELVRACDQLGKRNPRKRTLSHALAQHLCSQRVHDLWSRAWSWMVLAAQGGDLAHLAPVLQRDALAHEGLGVAETRDAAGQSPRRCDEQVGVALEALCGWQIIVFEAHVDHAVVQAQKCHGHRHGGVTPRHHILESALGDDLTFGVQLGELAACEREEWLGVVVGANEFATCSSLQDLRKIGDLVWARGLSQRELFTKPRAPCSPPSRQEIIHVELEARV